MAEVLDDLKSTLSNLGARLTQLRGIFDVDAKRDEVARLTDKAGDPELWTNADAARKVMQDKARLEKVVNSWQSIADQLGDAEAALEIAVEEDEPEFAAEAREAAPKLVAQIEQLELRTLLGAEEDAGAAIVEINSGAGGTDAQDWAEMLLRMYTRWAEQQGHKVSLLDRQDGEEAGIKSATLQVEGDYAYGFLKAEMGVHRLVRISPFDSNARRQTAFAAVAAYPDVDQEIEVDINEGDLRIDRYRASGAGGQHVNTTDSAVRITHEPTGIVVQCQNERSQHKNKATAMKVLRARLYQYYVDKAEAEAEAKAAPKQKIEWGSQIRSYVLQPYQMVKDLRTSHETGNVSAVLDGDLTPFMKAWLSKEAGQAEEDEA
ncbi:MAG: peptide chain release factor 2 [Deltaproteobacteria bacterium]|nr:peptide chain release factor 2 [Deltaproteobacteria bacterium]